MNDRNNQSKQIEYANKVMKLARNAILVRFRFFDSAFSQYEAIPKPGLDAYEANGNCLFYDPKKLLYDYLSEPSFPIRLWLHVLFHGIFLHPYRYDKENEHYWNIATDIAVENVVLSLDFEEAKMATDSNRLIRITKLKKWVPKITAERLYREFCVNGISAESEKEYIRLFSFDRHLKRPSKEQQDELILTKQDWEKVAQKVKAKIKTFSKGATIESEMYENLREATKVRQDYRAILNRFAVSGEEIKVSLDEFDYISYMYGLSLYDNLPLIEPLEYTLTKKIREFAIVLDTSASVRGEVLRSFLNETYSILSDRASFFEDVKIELIQCDHKVNRIDEIHSKEDLDLLVKDIQLSGFGATDFRPAFEYLKDSVLKKKYENLKGIIYFTDGLGIYPQSPPGFEVLFVYPTEDEFRPKAPQWAITMTLTEEAR